MEWLFCRRPETLSVGSTVGSWVRFQLDREQQKLGSSREGRAQFTYQGAVTQGATETSALTLKM